MARPEKQNKMAWYIAGFLAAIMILSVFGVVLSNPSDTTQRFTYGDYSFSYNQKSFRYETELKEKKVSFDFLPQDVKDLSLDPETLKQLRLVSVLAVTYDPRDIDAQSLGEMQFYAEQDLYDSNSIFVQRGLTYAEGYSLPEITCANATPAIPVLTIQFANQSGFRAEGSCFFLEGISRNELKQYYDRIRYALYGVLS